MPFDCDNCANMFTVPARDASGRFVKPKGPSQGHTDGDARWASAQTSRASSAAGYASEVEFLDSEAESNASFATTTTEDRQRATKRSFMKDGSGSSPEPNKRVKARAKKKAVPADTHVVGLAEAKRELSLARKQRLQQDFEEVVAAKEKRAQTSRGRSGYGASTVMYPDFSLTELARMAQEDEEEIVEVASKSSNLKGTFQKSLKCRAASLRGIVRELVERKTSDETRQLQAKVDRLQSEVNQLHKKLAEMTARPAQPTSGPAAEGLPSNLEEVLRKVVMEERAFTRACIAGIEDRLLPEKRLRPPLAADKKKSAPRGEDAPSPSTSATPSAPLWTEVVKKKVAKKAKKTAAAAAATAVPVPAGKGKEREKGEKSASQSSTAAPAAKKTPPAKAGKKKLTPPKSAAVVVTLTEEAMERGETYTSVLSRARPSVDPVQLGITAVSCRRTQTGARIFEFPGAEGGAKADLFASKLREVVADTAKVVRPVKLAALEVVNLDDSVTQAEVEARIASIGGCETAAIKGRAIRPNRSGMGAMRLELPVAAAQAVLSKGRILVGFSSAVVRALESQPLRCFRCFGIGHTRALCTSTADRTDACYRCGKDGHKSSSCKAATPHCAVCAASGRPAGHVMKGRNCRPPPKKGKAQARTRPAATTAAVPPTEAPAGVEGGAMTIDG